MLLYTPKLWATHIVGGEITYAYLGNDRYRIRLDVFVDCINGQSGAINQDQIGQFGVFDSVTGNMISSLSLEVSRSGPNRIVKTNYNCMQNEPTACVDHYWYEFSITLPPRKGGYYISYQRCCRNQTINNLQFPGATGANYWTHIPDRRWLGPNSSATFNELPPNFLCTNTPLKFDHSAFDSDGDSLAYDLFWPYLAATQNTPYPRVIDNNLDKMPFRRVVWNAGYDETNPIDGNPPLSINEENGQLYLVPTVEGQFVVGIRVKEYRKGILISETKRDYQFNVQKCIIDVVAAYYAPNYICGRQYNFKNTSAGAQRYSWNFGVEGTTADTSNLASPTFTFPAPGKYTVTLKAYKNKCVDSSVQTVIVLDPVIPKLPKDTILCKGASFVLKPGGVGERYFWSTGAVTSSITVSSPGMYWVEIAIKSCYWRDTININYDNEQVQLPKDSIVCTSFGFNIQLNASNNMQSYVWNTGATSPSIVVSNKGNYWVKGTTVNGCISYDSTEIKVFSPVKAAIPDTTICSGSSILCDAGNTGATYEWSNGATTKTQLINQPGKYWIKVSRDGCNDYDEFEISHYPETFQLGPDLAYCQQVDTWLSVQNKNAIKAVWNNEVDGLNFQVTKPGKVKVVIENSFGCKESDSLWVIVRPNPSFKLPNDTTVCLSVNPILNAPYGMSKYLWSNGKTEQQIIAYDTGLYFVKAIDRYGCIGIDSVYIRKSPDLYPSEVYMPSAFTPNGDGLNDLYPQNQHVHIGTLYNVKLYNRWGEKLADFNSPHLNWDGNINGKPAQEGTYVFLVSWIGCNNRRQTIKGDFTLLR